MKVPLEWLKDYVAIRLSPEALAERLTMGGFEVTGIERIDGEPVFHLEITPNRADCLSLIGLAREVAALTGRRLKSPLASSLKLQASGKRHEPAARSLQRAASLRIRIEDRAGCRGYVGRLLEGVAIGSSPDWMQRRLLACGVRPINNVVDVTNYVLLECGQPLHAFDYDRLTEETILVRRARTGETMLMIDGQARAFSDETLVIADATRAVAVAGVMGGRDTGITPATKRILLESAWFEPTMVRRAGRALGVSTESSYRFERGVDPEGVEPASRRAAALITQLAGGREVAAQSVGDLRSAPRLVTLDVSRVQRHLGVPLQSAKIAQSLRRLGCAVQTTGKSLRVRVPSLRLDIQQDVDLIEDVARLYGYDRLPATLPRAPLAMSDDGQHFSRVQEARRLCMSLGLSEIVTWALVDEKRLAQCGLVPASADAGNAPRRHAGILQLANPLSQDHAVLRPTLLIGMLQVVGRNLAHGAPGVGLFEVGNVFAASPVPQERLHLGMGITGLWERHWQGKQEANLFVLKGMIEQLVHRLVRQPVEVKPVACPWSEPGQSMEIVVAQQPLGVVGQVARRISHAFDLDKAVWFSEFLVDALLQSAHSVKQVSAPSAFPPVKRDVSFLVDTTVPCAALLELMRTVGAPLISHVELIDRYTGPQIPPAKQSLTASLEYRHPSRTLTAEEADRQHQRIGHELVQRFGVQLR
ncbi:MAG: phenylalanine--tRNA ligase subunit beta [Candidatus Omnitrophica bacterium]|nr:phenylalanine--tRNA ligase subunit beta [Candidatus Omnitrophota bacterium]